MEDKKQPYGTAIVKSIDILNFMAEFDRPVGVKEISEGTGMNKSTAHKILATLLELQIVNKDKSANYSLGLALIRIARAALANVDIVRIASPYLQQLNETTGETVHLGVLDGHRVSYVSKMESKWAVRMYSRVGSTAPLYCTGVGKALLSCFNEKQLDDYMASVDLVKYTDTTITSKDELRKELVRIHLDGYSIDNNEHEEDVRCVAVSLNIGDRLYGAFSLSAPKYRMSDSILRTHLPLVLETKSKILNDLKVFL